jgi:hypothetical protein
VLLLLPAAAVHRTVGESIVQALAFSSSAEYGSSRSVTGRVCLRRLHSFYRSLGIRLPSERWAAARASRSTSGRRRRRRRGRRPPPGTAALPKTSRRCSRRSTPTAPASSRKLSSTTSASRCSARRWTRKIEPRPSRPPAPVRKERRHCCSSSCGSCVSCVSCVSCGSFGSCGGCCCRNTEDFPCQACANHTQRIAMNELAKHQL